METGALLKGLEVLQQQQFQREQLQQLKRDQQQCLQKGTIEALERRLNSQEEHEEKLSVLEMKLLEATAEKTQLTKKFTSREILREVGQAGEAGTNKGCQATNRAEVSQLWSRFQEKADLASLQENEARELKEIAEQLKPESEDL